MAAALFALGMTTGLAGVALPTAAAAAATIELRQFELTRSEPGLLLDFEARFDLPAGVEDALQKGVALHFVAEARLMRSRWYWRDKRVGQAIRMWRLTYQPLTFSYRVGMGGLSQSYGSLREAVQSLQSLARWRIADPDTADEADYLEFVYRLDVDQLPRPLLITLGNQPEWSLRIERTIELTGSSR